MVGNLTSKKISKFIHLFLFATLAWSFLSSPAMAMITSDASAATEEERAPGILRQAPLSPEDEASLELVTRALRSFPHMSMEAYDQPHPDLIPFAQNVERFLGEYVTANPHHNAQISPLMDEIRGLIGTHQVTMNALWEVSIQFAQSICPQSPEEERFLEKDGPYGSLLSLSRAEGNIPWFIPRVFATLHRNFATWVPTWESFLEDDLNRRLPLPVYYPVLGKSSFPLATFVRCSLKDVFPICIPRSSFKRHGVILSPWGATIDSVEEISAADRYMSFRHHVMNRARRSEHLARFARLYSPVAAQKYAALMEVLGETFKRIETLEGAEDPETYAKVVWGFYAAINSNFSPKLFEVADLEMIVTTLFALEDGEEDEGFDDESFLCTDPQTGASPKSDEEIIAWFKQNNADHLEEDAVGAVIRTPFSITIRFQYPDFHRSITSFCCPTLLSERQELLDSLRVLSEAGYRITPPNFTREDTLRALHEAEQAGETSSRYACEYALRTIKTPSQKGEESLQETFNKRITALEEEFQQTLRDAPSTEPDEWDAPSDSASFLLGASRHIPWVSEAVRSDVIPRGQRIRLPSGELLFENTGGIHGLHLNLETRSSSSEVILENTGEMANNHIEVRGGRLVVIGTPYTPPPGKSSLDIPMGRMSGCTIIITLTPELPSGDLPFAGEENEPESPSESGDPTEIVVADAMREGED